MKAAALLPFLLGGCLADTHFVIDSDVVADTPRLGLNLGSWSSWGDEQLMSNVLKNPGFEALQDRSLLSIDRVSGDQVYDRYPDAGREDGFWQHATLTVLNRDAANVGLRDNRHADGSYQLASHATLFPGDVARLEKQQSRPAVMWWPEGTVTPRQEPRPGSPGQQSLALASGSTLRYWLDSESGNRLPVEGPWQLRFWARADDTAAQLAVRFGRVGQPPLLQQTLSVSPDWQAFTLTFTGHTASKPGPLELRLQPVAGTVLLDDAWLGAEQDRQPFRQAVIDTLRQLRPGVLRDWQGQLGDSARNRLAPPWARQPVRYRQGEAETLFLYGLPEFLALARSIGSQPWIVLPTTLDAEETRRLGHWLRDHARGQTVWVEFGNENWNPLFRAAGLTDPASHAQLAGNRFALLQQTATGLDLRPVINGQFYNPEQAMAQATALPPGVRLAVGPYFALSPAPAQTLAQWREAALDDGEALRQRLQQQQGDTPRQIAAYELNFHSTQSAANPTQLAALVNSPQAGFILGWQLMRNQQAGISPQLLYTLSGNQTSLANGQGKIPLWGLTEQLAQRRLRPTGQAMALLNRAWGGPQRATQCQLHCDRLQLLAFGPASRPRLVAANRGADSEQLTVRFPPATDAPTYELWLLDGRDTTAGQLAPLFHQTIRPTGDRLGFTLPPLHLAVLLPQGESS